MHEYSIVQSLLESCEEHARTNNAKEVTKVIVKIGVLSGVEPDLYVSPVTLDENNEYSIIDNNVFKQPFLNIFLE